MVRIYILVTDFLKARHEFKMLRFKQKEEKAPHFFLAIINS